MKTRLLKTFMVISFLFVSALFVMVSDINKAFAQEDIIVDNDAATFSGTWITSTFQTNYYGVNYRYKTVGTGSAKVTWTPTIPTTSVYDIYYWLPDGTSDRTTSAAFTVNYSGGSRTYYVDETAAGGKWVKLGAHEFAAGTSGNVELSDSSSGTYVIADAVKFVESGVILDNSAADFTGAWTTSSYQPNYYGTNYSFTTSVTGSATATARWTPNLPSAGKYDIYYWLPTGGADRASNAPFSVYYNGGSITYNVNETGSGGAWVKLGTQEFLAGTSGYVQLSNKANGTYVIADAIKFVPTPAALTGTYTITDTQKQTIWGLGVEIQSDSIGSGNNGLPNTISSVPHDLVESEKTRLYGDMLHGFRYLRLAMGLYYRGLTPDNKSFVERFPGQNADLSNLISQSGMEGVDVEYWSPAPYWKANNSLLQTVSGDTYNHVSNTSNSAVMTDFGNHMVQDLNNLTSNGIPVSMWSLQNEPSVNTFYSSSTYSSQQYYDTFKIVAPLIKTAYPNIFIHANSEGGQNGVGSGLIRGDAAALAKVNGWSWHRIGYDSNDQITNANTYNSNLNGKVVFNDEFEYLDGTTSPARMINTAQSIMNWMTFENSPTWFWLHALKSTNDSIATGYGLGVWRPSTDTNTSHYSNVSTGHFDYLSYNYNAIAGFLAYMPWNSVRYEVTESKVLNNNRIMAWRKPDGKLVFALTNRAGADFNFSINLGSAKTFTGHLYDSSPRSLTQADNTGQYLGKPLGTKSGSNLSITVPDLSIQFWVEN